MAHLVDVETNKLLQHLVLSQICRHIQDHDCPSVRPYGIFISLILGWCSFVNLWIAQNFLPQSEGHGDNFDGIHSLGHFTCPFPHDVTVQL